MKISIRHDTLPSPTERRRLRTAAGLTGIELAVAMGVSPASVYALQKALMRSKAANPKLADTRQFQKLSSYAAP